LAFKLNSQKNINCVINAATNVSKMCEGMGTVLH